MNIVSDKVRFWNSARIVPAPYLLTNLNKDMTNTTYKGTYKVVTIFFKSGRRRVEARNLTEAEAQSRVRRYKSRAGVRMTVYTKQYSASKYFARAPQNPQI